MSIRLWFSVFVLLFVIAPSSPADTPPTAKQRNPKWWRAGFHELECLAKIPQRHNKDILHTIEVLQNSFADIPPLRAEQHSSLNQRRKGDDNTVRL